VDDGGNDGAAGGGFGAPAAGADRKIEGDVI
jgi:hypothetical protein